jgi:citrate lyase subunit beta/citryl-CoA lyase
MAGWRWTPSTWTSQTSTGPRAECQDAVAVGFDATIAIHPSQVPVIRDAYRPRDHQVDWARRLLAAVGDQRGVSSFEGRMVDGPIFRQAERIMQLHHIIGSPPPVG